MVDQLSHSASQPEPESTPPPSAPEPTSATPPPTSATATPATSKTVTHGSKHWAVYLAVLPWPEHGSNPGVDKAVNEANKFGNREFGYSDAYYIHHGELGCDAGALDGLIRDGYPLDRETFYESASLLFETERDAKAFIAAYPHPVMGPVQIQIKCME